MEKRRLQKTHSFPGKCTETYRGFAPKLGFATLENANGKSSKNILKILPNGGLIPKNPDSSPE